MKYLESYKLFERVSAPDLGKQTYFSPDIYYKLGNYIDKFKDFLLNESVTPNSVMISNNKMKNVTNYISSEFQKNNIEFKEKNIQELLNSYVDGINKKSSYMSELINKNRPSEEIAKVYSSTFVEFFHQKFKDKMNSVIKMSIRNTVDKKTFEEHKIGVWKIPFKIFKEGINSLPVDEKKKSEIRKFLLNKKDQYSFDLYDYAIKKIYG